MLVLIIFPIIFFVLMAVIFGSFASSLTPITQQEFLLNCPLPIQTGSATNVNIVGTQVNYTATISPNIPYVNGGNATTLASSNGVFFNCFIQPNGLLGVFAQSKPYGLTTFQIPTGAVAYYGDTIWSLFTKVQPAITLMFLYIQEPALVTGIAYFDLVTAVLTLMIGIGIVLVFRGNT